MIDGDNTVVDFVVFAVVLRVVGPCRGVWEKFERI